MLLTIDGLSQFNFPVFIFFDNHNSECLLDDEMDIDMYLTTKSFLANFDVRMRPPLAEQYIIEYFCDA
jgi:hypothetical protein